MAQTKLSIIEDKFYMNGNLTYAEIPGCTHQGLLMNARFIQGIFDDKTGMERYQRFGRHFDAEKNTQELIAALPEWYAAGLRAITVGFQGGGPCFTIDNFTIENNPFGRDGVQIDPAYLTRMDRIIRAADAIGMAVIVSLFYGAQSRFLEDDRAVENAVRYTARWLKENTYKNVIIEIANEHDVDCFAVHPILSREEGIVKLIRFAREESGGMPVGCSGTGGYFSKKIAEESDVILIHGNGQNRSRLQLLINKAKAVRPVRPVVINEDSQAISQLEVTFQNEVSWGYYNNMTKQEPPVDWGITKGEDTYFALRMKEYLGIERAELPFEEQFYIQGLEKEMVCEGKRFVRLASLYPEKINYVEFYRNGVFLERAYDDPFSVNYMENWLQGPVEDIQAQEVWEAVIYLHDGRKVIKTVQVEGNE